MSNATKYQHIQPVGRTSTYHFSILEKEIKEALGPKFERILNELRDEIKLLTSKVERLEQKEKGSHEEKRELLKIISNFVDKVPGVKNRNRVSKKITDSYLKKLKPEIEIGNLATYSDGTIRFNGSVIQMRDQLNDLCRMFMSRPNQLVLYDEIRDEIIRAERRERTRFPTIAKYVSELHSLLKPCLGKDVIFNHKKEGWRFVP